MSDAMSPLLRPICWLKGHQWSGWNEGLEAEVSAQMWSQYRACWRCGKVANQPKRQAETDLPSKPNAKRWNGR